ncbi:MAG: ABC transporter ATP-binding protein [Ignavibacteria bacterium]|nr:ABC transporter ATP-binding protein [Ignavibacteria bacterium]
MKDNEVIVELKNISKKFENIEALREISFSVRKGELFGLVGPDGAGKTTLIRILCGVEEKSSGEIFLFNLDADKHRSEINRRIGYLSQRFSLYGDLTIDENIEFFARIHGVKNFDKRRDELLEFTRLINFRKRLVDKLSGGMKQKTALACALIHEPDILFLDEPTNGVDPVSRRDFWSILAELQKQGITIIISTPYLEETERCERIAIMNSGRLMIVDEPKNLKNLIKEKVYEIICSPVRKAFKLIKEYFPHIEVQMFGDNINIISNEEVNVFSNFLLSNGVEIVDLKQKIPSVENVFIYLLRKEETNEV